MKKFRAAILICDLMIGLLLFCGYLYKQGKERPEEWLTIVMNTVQSENKTVGRNEGEEKYEAEYVQKERSILREVEIKKIALTFDDGPHPYYTEQLLDGLQERGVVATFFVTGEHAVLHPEVIKRMQEEGHLIGNHTYSHIQLRSDNKEKFKEELRRTNEVLKEIIGEDIIYVRPPYGSWDKSFEKELNMIPVLWTVDPLDWCSDDVSCVVRSVTEKVKENDIVLLHDYYDSTVTAALKIVDELLEEGYSFVTVEEILFE